MCYAKVSFGHARYEIISKFRCFMKTVAQIKKSFITYESINQNYHKLFINVRLINRQNIYIHTWSLTKYSWNQYKDGEMEKTWISVIIIRNVEDKKMHRLIYISLSTDMKGNNLMSHGSLVCMNSDHQRHFSYFVLSKTECVLLLMCT